MAVPVDGVSQVGRYQQVFQESVHVLGIRIDAHLDILHFAWDPVEAVAGFLLDLLQHFGQWLVRSLYLLCESLAVKTYGQTQRYDDSFSHIRSYLVKVSQ
jgi:hypothetical protein